MWKGLAGPNGARLGVHAAMMAAAGITGPDAPYEGPNGLWKLTTGKPHAVSLPTSSFQSHSFAIEATDIKLFPVRNGCQLPVLLALELRNEIQLDAVAKIETWTDEHTFGVASKEPALWNPVTRESADHSLPFCIAAALLDGKIGIETFEAKRFMDKDVRALIGRTRMSFDAHFSAIAPATRSCRMAITEVSGRMRSIERAIAPGDEARQPCAARVDAKFTSLVERMVSADRAEAVLAAIHAIEPTDPASSISACIPDLG